MAKLNLNQVPKPARTAIAIVPAILYALVFTFLVLMPKHKIINAKRAEIVAQENDITKTQGMAARLGTLRAENESLRKRLEVLSEQLPEEKEVTQLLRQVSDKSIDSNLQILTWKPEPKKLHPSKIVYEIPVDITVSGSYHDLGRFFSSLTRLKRIVNISDIRMGGAKPNGNEAALSISFKAVTYTAAESGGLSK
ncbi:MAG: type 4a pilus biogenesis protein PilO [Nitrospiraceae bacterium]|nr:type 4a pilus biogenesis protein PilO [Nitrospiraceae bacterium]